MKPRRSTIRRKQFVIQELIKSGGNSTIACFNAGIARSTFYKWQEEDEQFSSDVMSIICKVKNFAEDKLMLAAMQGDPKAWKKKFNAINKTLEKLKKKHLNR